MRPGQNQKRRNNNNRPSQHGGGQHSNQGNRRFQNNGNRSYDSNGPDVKVRGTAAQVYEKYQALARDAHSSGDNIMTENYLQHAEHYYRLMNVAAGEDGQQNRGQNRRDFGSDYIESEGEATTDRPVTRPDLATEQPDIGTDQPEFSPPAFLQANPSPAGPSGRQPDVQAPQFGGNRFGGRERFQRRMRTEDGMVTERSETGAHSQPAVTTRDTDRATTAQRPVLARPIVTAEPVVDVTPVNAGELTLAVPAMDDAAVPDATPVRRRVGRPRRVKPDAVETPGE